jgi:integrase
VRAGKGNKDRVTLLAASSMQPLQSHLLQRQEQHVRDLARRLGEVYLPYAPARKYPNAGSDWGWQFVFAASRDVYLPEIQRNVRWHLHEKTVQHAVRQAVRRAGLIKPASCHTFRHSLCPAAKKRTQPAPVYSRSLRSTPTAHEFPSCVRQRRVSGGRVDCRAQYASESAPSCS